MPKEVIRDTAGMYDIAVGWSVVDEYVQLGAVFSKNGKSAVKIVDLESDLEYTGLWSTLSEEKIDELIKVLKRVKRKVYSAK